MDRSTASEACASVLDAVAAAVVADRSFLETIMLCALARGHVLLEDVPGTGKTLTARSVAAALGLSFSRVQFTPDLLPSDVTGTHIFNERDRSFEFAEGPLFANVVLADEINRAPPKTQAALLEAMEERQVTVGDETFPLPDPFLVIATQNPIEQEGTFPLPEAQVDRFLARTSIGYPDADGEVELLRRRAARDDRSPTVEAVLDVERVSALQRVPESVHVEEDLLGYMAELARATRRDGRVEIGVSPRGTQRLFEASRAHAVLGDRDYVIHDDVATVAVPTLAHRLVLAPEAVIDDLRPEAVIETVLEDMPVPTVTAA